MCPVRSLARALGASPEDLGEATSYGMDNTSFAPGNNSINNSVPPPTQQYSAPEHKHFLNKKFIITFVVLILLGVGAYAGIWYWENQQTAQEVAPTFTPRADVVSDWKMYTNVSLGFSIQYPTNLTPTLEINDQYNRLTSFGPSKTNTTFEVRLQKDTDPSMGIKYGFLGSEVTSTNIKLSGINGYEAISKTGYGDAGSQGQPYAEFAARHNGDVYHLIFYGDSVVSAEENQILSTFKFIP
ncbi:MAG: hypothetical protein AAB374_03030 [Patescibacteria group bacterium]